MLRRCLVSIIGEIERVNGHDVQLLVVENESKPNCLPMVGELREDNSVEITYQLEPKIGIVAARNKALSVISECDADWACFIDDDAVVASGWLLDWIGTIAAGRADIFQGQVKYQVEDQSNELAGEKKTKSHADGQELKTAATCNTFFSIKYVREFGLRFDQRFNLTGGEDTEFFYRCVDHGAKIAAANRPTVYEFVSKSRQNFFYTFSRHFSVGVNQVRISRARKDWFCSLVRYGPKAVGRMLYAVLFFVPIMTLELLLTQRGVQSDQKVITHLASSSGIIWGLLGFEYKMYRVVDGH